MPPSFHIWITVIISLLVHLLLFLPLSKTFLLRYKLGHVMLHLKSLTALSVDSQQKEYLLMIYKTCMVWLVATSPSNYRQHDLLTVPSIYQILSYSRTIVFAVIFSLNTNLWGSSHSWFLGILQSSAYLYPLQRGHPCPDNIKKHLSLNNLFFQLLCITFPSLFIALSITGIVLIIYSLIMSSPLKWNIESMYLAFVSKA